ncbi:hypothetical protein BHE75_01930 [Sphingomonas haloaromaticamans]|uniref:Uncharacterized protein n=1 Tax=Edaphosphingomonas haloaromaticamans TaxID=653954 RepID=A0A1S1HCS7_9SPHN|nr:hypothetical protein BHE75_01930 [Sphingomonas haloaromaticamans]
MFLILAALLASTEKPTLVERMLARPPDAVFESAKTSEDVHTCLTSIQTSLDHATVPMKDRVRIVFESGVGIVDLYQDGTGTRADVWGFSLARPRVRNWVRRCV